MGQRINLQQELQDFLGVRTDGKQNVFFQPPESVKLVYPCIIYQKSAPNVRNAANKSYTLTKRYDLTLITNDPDSDLADRLIKKFPMISLNRSYATNNLNHDAFTLYY